eukprot:1098446-Pyramimonas_sp.AAC.1
MLATISATASTNGTLAKIRAGGIAAQDGYIEVHEKHAQTYRLGVESPIRWWSGRNSPIAHRLTLRVEARHLGSDVHVITQVRVLGEPCPYVLLGPSRHPAGIR